MVLRPFRAWADGIPSALADAAGRRFGLRTHVLGRYASPCDCELDRAGEINGMFGHGRPIMTEQPIMAHQDGTGMRDE